ncbi:MAG: Kelch repeat-containing protein [Candidatus Acidiferrales bacterium]
MAGVVHGVLMIVGGSYWENGVKRRTELVQCFSPDANAWQYGNPLPNPRSDGAAVTLRDRMYIFGGISGNTPQSNALVLENAQWNVLPGAELPEPRVYPAAIASADSIYLFGGMLRQGDYRTITNTFWRWQHGSAGWESLPSFPGLPRIHSAMAELNGELYIFGGATAVSHGVENRNDAYKYDPINKNWTRLPALPVANRSWSAVSLGGRILLLAGYTNDFARAVYVYHPRNPLHPANSLPRGLADIKFFRIGGQLVGAGGEIGHGRRGKWTFRAEIPRGWLSELKALS